MLSVLLWYTDSDYTLVIFWPLCCLFFYDLHILITPMVSFGHLFFYNIQILITPLVSFGHCVVCSFMGYEFWLPLGIFWLSVLLWYTDSDYLLGIFWPSVLLWYTDSDYPLGIFWPLCCLFFYDIQILIILLVSFGHCVVCSSMIYRFWLPPWYPLAIVLSVLLWYTDSDYPLGIFWPLCCLFFHDLQILITPLVSFGHCVVCSSMIYRFWLHPWYLLVIVLSVPLWYTDSDYPLGIFWPLCCLFFYDIQILITPMVYFGHCVVCSSMVYRFWLHPWYLLAIVLSVLLWYTDSDYTLVIFWPLCCLFFYDIQILITPWYLLSIVLSVLLWYTDSDYPLGIFWPLCCLFVYDLQIVITPLVSFGHCVVCSSIIYRFWLHPWYLLAIVLSVLLWYTDFDYPLGIFWPLCFLFFYGIQILITPLVSFGHCVVCSSMIYRFWLSLLVSFGHCVVCSSMIYRNLITPLLSVGHCVVCSSIIYRFWLHPWHLLAIVLSVLLWYTDSDYTLGIFWPLFCLFFYDLWMVITPLVSFGHCVVCSLMSYGFWLHPWYLLAIVFSVLLWYTDSDYALVIFWPWCFPFFYDIQIMITPLVSSGHCVVCSSMTYRFWLYTWYHLTTVLSVLTWHTDSHYTLDIFWPLFCLFFYDIQILITPWYLLAIVLSVLLWYTYSDYTLGIFWPLCCLFFYDIQILITPLVSFGHCVVCSSMIYRFWLPPWYLLAIVFSVLLWYTDSDYTLGIFWPLCCLFFYDIQILIIPLGIFWPLCCLFFYDI